MSSSLQGKVAVITGASKGIGAGIAKAFGAEGASVVVNYSSSREGADAVVKSITDAGGKAIAVQANVSVQADVDRLFAETKSAYGKVDVLVNNAGVYKFGSIEEFTEAEWQRQFGTNVLGMLLVTQAAVKLIGAEGGSIINIGSAVTALNFPNTVIYTATKGAVDSITGVLAKDLGARKIRVNSINPGVVETEGNADMNIRGGEMEKMLIAQTPLGRYGQPDDIAKIAVFLAGDASGWLTGEHIIASGGFR